MSFSRHKAILSCIIFGYLIFRSLFPVAAINNFYMINKNIKRAIKVAIVVGSLLNTINSYDVFWYGNFTPRNVIRIVLTYITPFCVSLYSSIKATKNA